MRLRFLGANQTVTGSKHFVETEGFRFLVDCGMSQERSFQARNWDPCPEAPSGIDAIFLTHAHLDHCGLIPKLVQDGFKGKIYGTPATIELAKLILADSAHIQEEDAAFKQKRHLKEKRQSPFPVRPLYTKADVDKAAELFRPIPYNTEKQITPNVSVVFYDAGHVLGSAFIEVMIREDGQERRLLFSGDLGRADRPILRDPEIFNHKDRPVDIAFLESTYGDRESDPIQGVDDQLATVISRTVKRGGKVIMPVFAVERAQEMIYRIAMLMDSGRIPGDIPVYLDSPMAVEATHIFMKHSECFDDEMLKQYERACSGEKFDNLYLLKTREDSQSLNTMDGPALIMSSAGMCNAGRIKHHLANHIGYKENTVLFLGYQAAGTLGRQIVEGNKTVRILGEIRKVKAEIVSIRGISGHADRSELYDWFEAIPKSDSFRLFIVHGEETSSESLAALIRKKNFGMQIDVPEYGEEFTL